MRIDIPRHPREDLGFRETARYFVRRVEGCRDGGRKEVLDTRELGEKCEVLSISSVT